ncbi:hypothetical protein HY991_04795 [Candidatus Micrarchaeota archaeon]|nr:hypothetical protein [Candidatus Micrarchaeota archaeon]
MGFLSLFGFFVAANFMKVYADSVVTPGSNFTVVAGIYNSSNPDQVMGFVNITAGVPSGGCNWTNSSNTTGTELNVTAPTTPGEYNMTINASSEGISKTITIFVTNVSSGTITYVNKKPPFAVNSSANNTIVVNVTILNASGSPVVNYYPSVEVYSDDGSRQSWTISSLSNVTDSTGSIAYNITIPNTADGAYFLSVERGAVGSVFFVKSDYVISVATMTTGGESTANFYPGETVLIQAKVRDVSQNPQTSLTVNAFVTLPNNTVVNFTLNEQNATSLPGYYNNSFATPQSFRGTYDVKVVSTIAGKEITAFSSFTVSAFEVELETRKDFFNDEWSAFAAGGRIGLNVIVVNVTSDSPVGSSVNGGEGQVNCSSINVTDVKNTNGTSVYSQIGAITKSTSPFMMMTVCRIEFTAPSASGYYEVDVNVTVGTGSTAASVTGQGFFSVQRYRLKVNPIVSVGGGMEFKTVLYPGDNATFSLSAYNITNGTTVNGTALSGIRVLKLIPAFFAPGVTEVANVTYWVESGESPRITIAMPNVTGPYQLMVQATLDNENVTGAAFFVSKYVMGFVQPAAMGGQEGPPMGLSCNGTFTFSGNVMDTKNYQGVQGVVFNPSVLEAREEATGKSIKDCISVSSGITNNQGQISVNVTFNTNVAGCASLSGFNFIMFNVTYKGNYDFIPSGFQCKRLNFMPEVRTLGSSQGNNWQIAPNAPVLISVSNVSRLSNNAKILGGNLSITRIMNFNPQSGGKMYTPNVPLIVNLTSTVFGSQVLANGANLTLYPQNFTDGTSNLTAWPSGFVDIMPRVCDNGTGNLPTNASTCDTEFGGFKVVAFNLWIDWSQSYGSGQVTAGEQKSVILHVQTNASKANLNQSFRVSTGKPWEGGVTPATLVEAKLQSDMWNNTGDTLNWQSTEKWNVTFIIPINTRSGESMVTIAVNNTDGEEADTEMMISVQKFVVVSLAEEGFEVWKGRFYDGVNSDGTPYFWNSSGGPYTDESWNMTIINSTLGVNSRSNKICGVTGINVTRWSESLGNPDRTATYSITAKVLVLDNQAQGAYDTLVIQLANGTNASYSATQGLALLGGGLYLTRVEDCGYVVLANATYRSSGQNNWGGTHPVNANFYIPYGVRRSSLGAAYTEVNVSIGAVAKQQEGGGGGFGMERLLTPGTQYQYLSALSDSYGIAWVRLNISVNGRYNVFWRAKSAEDPQGDAASFSSGINVEIKARQTDGRPVNGTITNAVLTYNPTPFSYGPPNNPVSTAYLGTINETSITSLVWDGVRSNFTLALVNRSWTQGAYPASTEYDTIIMDDDANLSYMDQNEGGLGTHQLTMALLNETDGNRPRFDQVELRVGQFRTLSNTTKAISLFAENPSLSGDQQFATTSNVIQNVTFKVCASTFSKPAAGVENASVYLYVMKWEFWPPRQINLTMYDPINGTALDPSAGGRVKTGPNGCVAVKAFNPEGWSTTTGDEVQASVTYTQPAEVNGLTDSAWIGRVMKTQFGGP